MTAFPARRLAGDIDGHRETYGVEPICEVLPAKSQSSPKRAAFAAGLHGIAPPTHHEHKARQADFSRMPPCAQRDAALRVEIKRVFDANFRVYGVRKGWRQLRREGVGVARCAVARLMKSMGLAGAVRGKTARTTISNKAAPCPLDRMNRQFRVPAPCIVPG